MGKIVDEISLYFGVDVKTVQLRVNKHNKFYKHITIPKRNGSGVRDIYLPTIEMKAFQHFISEKYLDRFPISKCATAYTKKRNTTMNAVQHLKNSHFLHIDISNFFDSISFIRVKEILNNGLLPELNQYDVDEMLKLITYKDSFVQGGVTSPKISNIFMYNFDLDVCDIVKNIPDGQYTRYSDDITISSSQFVDKGVLTQIESLLKKYELNINMKKTHFSSNNKIRLTGINLVNHHRLSVGTEYKKKLKNMIYHKLKFRETSKQTINEIIGSLFYLKYIEPEYYAILNLKYSSKGKTLMSQLVKMNEKISIKSS